MLFTILVSALIGGTAVLLIQQWLRDTFHDSDVLTTASGTGFERPQLQPVTVPGNRRLAGTPAGMAPERMRRAG